VEILPHLGAEEGKGEPDQSRAGTDLENAAVSKPPGREAAVILRFINKNASTNVGVLSCVCAETTLLDVTLPNVSSKSHMAHIRRGGLASWAESTPASTKQ